MHANRTSPSSPNTAARPAPSARTRTSPLLRWVADWSAPANTRWQPPLIAAAERAVNGARASRSERGHTTRMGVQRGLERCA
jgi:hypothetical protein